MEQQPKNEISRDVNDSIEELATELEGIMLTLVDIKRQITESQSFLSETQSQFAATLVDLDPHNPNDQTELAQMQHLQDQFVTQIQLHISSLEGFVAELELVHAEEIKMFEQLKALKRQADFGIPGTAH